MTTRWSVGLVTNARIFFVPTEKEKKGYSTATSIRFGVPTQRSIINDHGVEVVVVSCNRGHAARHGG